MLFATLTPIDNALEMGSNTHLDIQALSRFVQEQHLEPEALAARRAAFSSHPARLTVIENFLHEPLAEQLAAFLDNDAVFAGDYGLYSHPGERVKGELFDEATDDDRFFKFRTMVGVDPAQGLSDTTFAFMQFRRNMQSDVFGAFFEQVTGLELVVTDDFVLHRMEAGDYLGPHDDRGRGRRVATVTYLTPGWTPDMGGQLVVLDREGGEHVVEPSFNSIVVFEVAGHKLHHVERVSEAAGERARNTVGGWYHYPAGTEPG